MILVIVLVLFCCPHVLSLCDIQTEKDALKKNFACTGSFSYNEQADLMALSENIYYQKGESVKQYAAFKRRYESYTQSIGGSKTTYFKPIKLLQDFDFTTPDPFCAMTRTGITAVIVCRGTNNLNTVVSDLLPRNVPSTNVGPGTVDEGFYLAYSAISEQIDASIKKLGANANIYCTGHSSGGALAMLICERAVRHFCAKVCGVYTFGSPNLGTQSFAKEYKNEGVTYRYEIQDDPVPQLPTYYPNNFTFGVPVQIISQIAIPINVTAQVIISHKEGYVKIGSVQGSMSTCKLVKNKDTPNYNEIISSYVSGNSECTIKSHLPEVYCARLKYRGTQGHTAGKIKCGDMCTNMFMPCRSPPTNIIRPSNTGSHNVKYTVSSEWRIIPSIPTVVSQCSDTKTFSGSIKSSLKIENSIYGTCSGMAYSVVRKNKKYGMAFVRTKQTSYRGGRCCDMSWGQVSSAKARISNTSMSLSVYYQHSTPTEGFSGWTKKSTIIPLEIKVKKGIAAQRNMYGDRYVSTDREEYFNANVAIPSVTLIPKGLYLCTPVFGVSFNTEENISIPQDACSFKALAFNQKKTCAGIGLFALLCNSGGSVKAIYRDSSSDVLPRENTYNGQLGTFINGSYIILKQNVNLYYSRGFIPVS